MRLFQLTRPCGSRPSNLSPVSRVGLFQLTRPCGSRLDSMNTSPNIQCFNSRDPAGRDPVGNFQMKHRLCFNSRDPAGRDLSLVMAASRVVRFQLTRPCGSRLFPAVVFGSRLNVSTHATLRVATDARNPDHDIPAVSTHATLRVATLRQFYVMQVGVWFQLTRPCGSRRNAHV